MPIESQARPFYDANLSISKELSYSMSENIGASSYAFDPQILTEQPTHYFRQMMSYRRESSYVETQNSPRNQYDLAA